MRFWLTLLLLVTGCAKTKQEETGQIRGKVLFVGKQPASKIIDLDQDPECVRAHGNRIVTDESMILGPRAELANVFVYIKSGIEGNSFAPPDKPVNIDQKGCWFHPRVLGIQTGQALSVTNSDPLTHNIHPMAQVNREWNQSQSQGADPLRRRFSRPEVMIPVKCNIHGWMRSYIGVVDHPYFAVTGPDGVFQLKNVPPGSYKLAAWHEKLGVREVALALASSAIAETAFTFKGE